MLSLKSLQCFVTLVKTKSFTRTAEELYLTQPTISKILQQLEEQLQVQLLVKPDHGRKRQIELTEIWRAHLSTCNRASSGRTEHLS